MPDHFQATSSKALAKHHLMCIRQHNNWRYAMRINQKLIYAGEIRHFLVDKEKLEAYNENEKHIKLI
jgi:hypothetical protein